MSAEAIGAEVLKVMEAMKPKPKNDVDELPKSEGKVSLPKLDVGTDTADEKTRLEKAQILPLGKSRKENSDEVEPVKRELDQRSEEKIKEIANEIERLDQELEEKNTTRMISESAESSNLKNLGIKTAKEEQEIRENEELLERMKQPSASVFLLSEKEKSKKNQDSLKKQEVYTLYNKMRKTVVKKNDTKPLENKGILVNKKQN